MLCGSAAEVHISPARVLSSLSHLLVAWMRIETVGFGNGPKKTLVYYYYFFNLSGRFFFFLPFFTNSH